MKKPVEIDGLFPFLFPVGFISSFSIQNSTLKIQNCLRAKLCDQFLLTNCIFSEIIYKYLLLITRNSSAWQPISGVKHMAISQSLAEKREEILKVAASLGARNLKVFGSFARGEERPDSDIDLLVEMAPDRSLLDIIAIKNALEDITHRKVDVVTEKALSPHIRDKILEDAVSI